MADQMNKGTTKHTLTLGDWSSSVTLEDEFWDEFVAIARRKDLRLAVLARDIANQRIHPKLSGAIRVYVLKDAMRRAGEHSDHIAELRSTVRALLDMDRQTRDGHAPIAAVIAAGRANG